MVKKRHDNHGLPKVCGCARRAWAKCPHPWHFNFKWNGTPYRFSLDRELGQPIRGKTEAQTAADNLRIAIRAGTFRQQPAQPTTPGALTLEAFTEIFLERYSKVREKRSYRNDASFVKQICAFSLDGHRWGSMRIAAVTEDQVEAFLTDLRAKGKSASAHNQYVWILKAMFAWAVRKGYLERSPIGPDIQRKKTIARNRRLQDGEESALLAAAHQRLQRLIIAALETACRQGELLSLQWADVNLERREIRLRAEKTKDAEDRIIPISTRLLAALEMGKTDPTGRDFGPEDYVFGDTVGRRITTVKTAWKTATTKIPGLRFHDLRHEAGSRLLERGWPLHHVQAMLGHANIKTTSIYLNAVLPGLHESMRKSDEARHGCKLVANEAQNDPQTIRNDTEPPAAKFFVN